MKRIKAVFFDIDGTLLSMKTHRVPESAIAAIRELRGRGIKTVIATGRQFSEIKAVDTGLFDAYVTMNGGCCLSREKKILFKKAIGRADIEACLRALENGEKFPCMFMFDDGRALNYVDQNVLAFSEAVEIPVPPLYPDLREAAGRDIYQINMFVDRAGEERLMRDVFANCVSSRWNPAFADVNPRGVDKAAGMDDILKSFGMTADEAMAIGDGGNDLPMIRHAGVGVAMGNAIEPVKTAADFTTEAVDEDGVAKALRHYGLI